MNDARHEGETLHLAPLQRLLPFLARAARIRDMRAGRWPAAYHTKCIDTAITHAALKADDALASTRRHDAGDKCLRRLIYASFADRFSPAPCYSAHDTPSLR